MNKQKILGQFRELLSAGGLLVFGVSDGVTAGVALAVAIFALAWSIIHHEGGEIIFTMVRKALGAVPAVLVSFDLITLEKAASLTGFIPLLVAMIWSFVSKGGQLPPVSGRVGAFTMAFLALSMFALPSCSNPSIPSVPSPEAIYTILDVAKTVIVNYK